MKMPNSLFGIFCFLFCFPVHSPAQNLSNAHLNYINAYSDLAVKHMSQFKIPASIKLAQALLESDAGRSRLARYENNHFGIKCNNDWFGPCATYADDTPKDRFRVYKSVKESYEDHSLFLQKPRYSQLFYLDIKDYTGWAKGLQQYGYATSKTYANSLIALIDRYELYRYDGGTEIVTTISTPVTPSASRSRTVYTDHGLFYVLAEEGDSFTQIGIDLSLKANKIAAYNDAPEDFPLHKNDIVYLQKKLNRAKAPYYEHVVNEGESIYSISQLYGIKVKSLNKFNKNLSNYSLTEGDVLRLR
jgi:LysM repeat protein